VSSGSISFTIGINNLPQHNHSVTVPGSAFTASSTLNATTATGTAPGSYGPTAGAMLGNSTAALSGGVASIYSTTTTPTVALAAGSVTTNLVGNANVNSGTTGAGAALSTPVVTSANVSLMPPYLGLNYIIAMEGIFPSRN
jgi:microcystin-dependent protein